MPEFVGNVTRTGCASVCGNTLAMQNYSVHVGGIIQRSFNPANSWYVGKPDMSAFGCVNQAEQEG